MSAYYPVNINENARRNNAVRKIEVVVEELAVLLNREGFLLKDPWNSSWGSLFYSYKLSERRNLMDSEYIFLEDMFFTASKKGVHSKELSEALLNVCSRRGLNLGPGSDAGWFIGESDAEEILKRMSRSTEKHKNIVLSLVERAKGLVTEKRSNHLMSLVRS